MKFCVKCGKSISKGVMCDTCGGREALVAPVKVSLCSCKRYLGPKGWREYKSLNELITNLIDPHPARILSKVDLNFESKEKKFKVKALFAGKEKEVEVVLRKRTCEKCEKKNTQYFQGILQIRYTKDKESKVVEDVADVVEMAKQKRVFVTKIVEQKRGVDLYLTSQRYLQVLAKKLQSKWGGILKLTSTLHTRNKQTSKDLYRVTALLTLYEFTKGSVIRQNGKLYHIKSLGKDIKAVDMKINKTKTISVEDYEVLQQSTTRVIMLKPNVEIMDPETYEPVPLRNPKETLKGLTINKKVNVVYDKGWWLVI